MIIRKFKKSDALEVYLICIESWIREVSKYYNKKFVWHYLKNISPKDVLNKKDVNRITLVAQEKKKIIGFISTKLKRKIAKIGGTYISPTFMNKGIGTKLYKKIETLLKKRKISKIQLFSSVSPLTVRFWQKNGFKIIEKKKIKMGKVKNFPVVIMEKHL